MRHIHTRLAASIVVFASTTTAVAGPGPFFGPPGNLSRPYPAPPGGWIAPLVTGAVVGAVVASQPRTVVVERPLPSQPVDQTSATTFKRVTVYIPECNCYRAYDVPLD